MTQPHFQPVYPVHHHRGRPGPKGPRRCFGCKGCTHNRRQMCCVCLATAKLMFLPREQCCKVCFDLMPAGVSVIRTAPGRYCCPGCWERVGGKR